MYLVGSLRGVVFLTDLLLAIRVSSSGTFPGKSPSLVHSSIPVYTIVILLTMLPDIVLTELLSWCFCHNAL